MWRRTSVVWGVGLSLVLHGAWFSSLRSGSDARAQRSTRAPLPYAAEFELASRPATEAQHSGQELPAVAGGPESASALDLDATDGVGGSGASQERATLLFSFVSPIALQDTELNNLDQNQTQRIRTASTRATQEERRATPNAAHAVFLASGAGEHQERRTPAVRDAQPGTTGRSGLPALAAHTGNAGGPDLAPTEASPGPAQLARHDSARGILRGEGRRASEAARVAFARPNVDQGPAATPAEAVDAKVRDNRDAELLAAALQRSIVDASTQRARAAGAGQGGSMVDGPGLAFSGTGSGARAFAYAPGPGNAFALDTSDSRYIRWFLEQKERVQSELIFPKPRALAKDQGVSVYRIVVRRDGRLAERPHLVRSSGFADFDEAAVLAIRRAVPFSPLPERLVPDAADLTLLIPIAFSNPMVQ